MADYDPSIDKIKAAVVKSNLSLTEIGCRMGYDEKSAKKSVWQLLNKTNDPRISMLRKLAKAVGVKVESLVK